MARFALYYTPSSEVSLWALGSSVIGYDAANGVLLPYPEHPIFSDILTPDVQAEPQRYGFHATLKAPFELRRGIAETDLLSTTEQLAHQLSTVVLPRLEVREMGGFVALTAPDAPTALGTLAASCVRHLEPMRAPLSAKDLARRLATPLTERQIGNMHRWGFPYVFADYTFHMTLTGKLDQRAIAIAQPALSELLAEVLGGIAIDAVSVMRQESRDTHFRILQRFKFAR